MTTTKFVLLGLVIVIVLFWGAAKYLPAQEAAENRLEGFAKTQFNKNILVLEKARRAGQLDDARFNRGYANELGMLHVRTAQAKDPGNGACQSELQVVGPGVTDSPLPASCLDNFQFPVWSEGPKKVLKAEWRTPGGLLIAGEPQLIAGYKSVAKPLGGNRWEVEGNVSYRHTHAADNIVLRITVE